MGLLAVAAILLAWTFAQVRWQSVWLALRGLRGWQLALLLALNLCLVALFSARWWLLLRMQGFKVSLGSLVVYRLAGFGVSYLTPGPQFGGEGWLVILLRRRHAVPVAEASASVALDKLIELLANFSFLAFGLLVSVRFGVFHQDLSSDFLVPLLLLLAIPFGLFATLASGILPATWLSQRWKRPPLVLGNLLSLVAQAERRSASLIRQRTARILLLYFFSLGIWLAMVGEYWLMLHFFGVRANLSQTLFSLTAARLAFLTPLPGGLGALEAAQAAAFQVLGYGASVGLSLSLLQRARDLLLAILGIGLGSIWHLRPLRVGLTQPDPNVVYPSPTLSLQEHDR